MYLGIVLFTSNRAAQGLAECEYASALNRNLAEAHASVGAAKLFVQRAAETEAHIQEALRLSPRDRGIHRWMGYVGNAKLLIGADAEAVVWLRQSLKANPNYPFAQFLLAAALAFLGELDEARAAVNAGLALDPTFTVRRFIRISLGPRGESGRVRKGMRLAGVPEG
jgi:tetratricopeptide (TPR) repeat protein